VDDRLPHLTSQPFLQLVKFDFVLTLWAENHFGLPYRGNRRIVRISTSGVNAEGTTTAKFCRVSANYLPEAVKAQKKYSVNQLVEELSVRRNAACKGIFDNPRPSNNCCRGIYARLVYGLAEILQQSRPH